MVVHQHSTLSLRHQMAPLQNVDVESVTIGQLLHAKFGHDPSKASRVDTRSPIIAKLVKFAVFRPHGRHYTPGEILQQTMRPLLCQIWP